MITTLGDQNTQKKEKKKITTKNASETGPLNPLSSQTIRQFLTLRANREPKELKMMVQSIRNVELAISGSGFKEPSESEKCNITIVRKSLHFKKNLKEGYIMGEGDFITLRPGSGISPMLIDSYLGKRLNQEVEAFSIIENGHFI